MFVLSSIFDEIIAPVGNSSSTVDSVKYGKIANPPPIPTTATIMIANKDLFIQAQYFFIIKLIFQFLSESFFTRNRKISFIRLGSNLEN